MTKPTPEYNAALLDRVRRRFRWAQLIPPIAAYFAFRGFVRPDRMPAVKPLSLGTGHFEAIEGHRIYVHMAGTGPAILLVHGWEASIGTMRLLFESLVNRGYRVVAFDMPAHGQSSGRESDILTTARIMLALAKRHGPFQAAIGHSFGGLALQRAVQSGLGLKALVLLASPARFTGMMERFAAALALKPSVERRFQRRVAAYLRPHNIWTDFEADQMLAQCRIPILVLHDQADTVIPVAEAENLAACHPHIQLILTEGAGHAALVFQRATLRACQNFLKEHVAAAALVGG